MNRFLLLLFALLIAGRTANAGVLSSFEGERIVESMDESRVPADSPIAFDEASDSVGLSSPATFSSVSVSMTGAVLAFDQCVAPEMCGQLDVIDALLPPSPDLDGLIKPPRSITHL